MDADLRPLGAALAPTLEEVTGAVLCGGRSARFGSDKALVRIGGRTLLERVVHSLAPARERLLVGRDYAVAGARLVPDQRPGLGPLAGLEATLAASSSTWVALAACDLPYLTSDYWRLLCSHAVGCQAVIVRGQSGRLEPLAALYHRSVWDDVSARLDAQALNMHELVRALAATQIDESVVAEACGADVLRNVNRRQDIVPDDLDAGGS